MRLRLSAWVQRASVRRSELRERGLTELTATLFIAVARASRAGAGHAARLRALGLATLVLLAVTALSIDAFVASLWVAAARAYRAGRVTSARAYRAAVITATSAYRWIAPRLVAAARRARLAAAHARARAKPMARVIADRAQALAAPIVRRAQARILADRDRAVAIATPRYIFAREAARRRASPIVRRVASRLPHVDVPSPSVRTLRVAALTTVSVFVIATVIGTTGLVAQRGTVAFGATTTLTIIGGDVSVSTDGLTFASAADGDIVRAGTTIRTGPNAYAVITYFEGSTVSIDPGSTLTVVALGLDPDGTTTISMRQDVGRTWHSVQKLLTGASRYDVATPTLTATVRGTMFAVGVTTDAQGELVSTVDTAEGVVAAQKPAVAGAPPAEVLVQPGFRATVKVSAPLEPPVPSPEPERTVTVTVGAGAGVVVDSVGRSNGFVNGKLVVQTPGARVERSGGQLVVTLPDIPDGKVVAVVDEKAHRGSVDVAAVVKEKGKEQERTIGTVSPGASTAVAAVEVRKGQTATVAAPASDEAKKDLAASVKVVDTKKAEDAKAEDEKKDESGPPGAPSGFAPNAQLPPLPFGGQAVAERPAALPVTHPAPEDRGPGPDKGPQGFVPTEKIPSLPSLAAPPPAPPPAKAAPERTPDIDKAIARPTPEPPQAPQPQGPPPRGPEGEAPPPQGPQPPAPPPQLPQRESPQPQGPQTERTTPEPASGFVPSLQLPAIPLSGGSNGSDKSNGKGPSAPPANDKKPDAPPAPGTKKP